MKGNIHDQTILVTGAAGFVGSHLVGELVDTNEVIALDHFNTNNPDVIADGATVLKGDIHNSNLIDNLANRVDIIFHQAARRGITESVKKPLETHAVNVNTTLDLLESARKYDTRIVLASSAAIYGETTEFPINESSPTIPISPYGTQKLTIDNYACNYARLYGLKAVVLRYFNIFGRIKLSNSYRSVMGVFIQQAENGGPLTVEGDGEQTRDFVHINDIIQANLLAATTEYTGEAFNIATGTETSIRELAELVRNIVDSSISIEYVDDRTDEVERSVADISKAKRLLNYEPSMTIYECLEEYQNHI